MFDPDATLEQVMNAVVLKWGTAAPLYNLTAYTGWCAKLLAGANAEKAARAAALMAQAAGIIEELEKA